jgi:hypothetical protein
MIHIDSGGGVFIIHIDIDNKKEKSLCGES